MFPAILCTFRIFFGVCSTKVSRFTIEVIDDVFDLCDRMEVILGSDFSKEVREQLPKMLFDIGPLAVPIVNTHESQFICLANPGCAEGWTKNFSIMMKLETTDDREDTYQQFQDLEKVGKPVAELLKPYLEAIAEEVYFEFTEIDESSDADKLMECIKFARAVMGDIRECEFRTKKSGEIVINIEGKGAMQVNYEKSAIAVTSAKSVVCSYFTFDDFKISKIRTTLNGL